MEGGFVCTDCGKVLLTEAGLSVHRERWHIPTTCEICEAQCENMDKLYEHRHDMHDIDESFICTDCDARYRTQQGLNMHRKSGHEGLTFNCPQCTAVFTQSSSYYRHYRTVHLEEDESMFPCPHCSVAFSRVDVLERHKLRHTGARRYVCDFTGCGREFLLKHHLERHHKVHFPEARIPCPHCAQTFTAVSSMQRHERRVHVAAEPSSAPLDS